MRNINELLIILRDNARVKKSWFGLKQRIASGLCYEISLLLRDGKITNKEYVILYNYINRNIPTYKKYIVFGWKPTLWRPRKEWLNKQIELTKYGYY